MKSVFDGVVDTYFPTRLPSRLNLPGPSNQLIKRSVVRFCSEKSQRSKNRPAGDRQKNPPPGILAITRDHDTYRCQDVCKWFLKTSRSFLNSPGPRGKTKNPLYRTRNVIWKIKTSVHSLYIALKGPHFLYRLLYLWAIDRKDLPVESFWSGGRPDVVRSSHPEIPAVGRNTSRPSRKTWARWPSSPPPTRAMIQGSWTY